MPVPTRRLATAAACSLAAFPTAVVALNIVQEPNYSARSQAMSELALGRGGGLMFAAFTLMGVGTFLLAGVLHRELPGAKVTPATLVMAALLDVTSAIFHTNRTGTPTTPAADVHEAAGIATFVLVVIAMVSTIRHLRRNAGWASFAIPTTVWSIAALFAFFLIPILGDPSFGLAQRIFVATWLSWMITTALRARHTAATAAAATPKAFAAAS